jgi:hypothetical protein
LLIVVEVSGLLTIFCFLDLGSYYMGLCKFIARFVHIFMHDCYSILNVYLDKVATTLGRPQKLRCVSSMCNAGNISPICLWRGSQLVVNTFPL